MGILGRCFPWSSRFLPVVVRIVIGDVRQLLARRRHLIFQPANFCDSSEELLERISVVERKLSVAGAQWSDLPESNQRLHAKALDRSDRRCIDSVRQLLHFLADRKKHIVGFVGARALATILECRNDLRRVFVVPVGRIPEFCTVFGVRLRQRGRPTPVRDIISIDQRLKSGAEFDQFGVGSWRGCRGDKPPTLTILAPAAMLIKRRRVGSAGSADVFVGGVLCTLSAWVIWITLRCGSG
jgi:hypothetical protein